MLFQTLIHASNKQISSIFSLFHSNKYFCIDYWELFLLNKKYLNIKLKLLTHTKLMFFLNFNNFKISLKMFFYMVNVIQKKYAFKLPVSTWVEH